MPSALVLSCTDTGDHVQVYLSRGPAGHYGGHLGGRTVPPEIPALIFL